MTSSKQVFVDSSGWIELFLKGERYHHQVEKYVKSEKRNKTRFFTCDYVLDETWTRMMTTGHLAEAVRQREEIYKAEVNQEITLLYTDKKLFERTWETFVKFADLKLSFTDALIVTVARQLKIDEILTLDQGFTKAGFSVCPTL